MFCVVFRSRRQFFDHLREELSNLTLYSKKCIKHHMLELWLVARKQVVLLRDRADEFQNVDVVARVLRNVFPPSKLL